MLRWIDNFLLNAAQKFCNKFQRLTGLTKFWLEKWSCITGIAMYWMFILHPLEWVLIPLGFILAFTGYREIRMTEARENAFLVRQEIWLSVENHPHFRTMCLGLFGISAIVTFILGLLDSDEVWLWFSAWNAFTVVKAYFAACIPKPPSKSKMQEWLEKGLMKFRDLLPPVSEPVPVPNQ